MRSATSLRLGVAFAVAATATGWGAPAYAAGTCADDYVCMWEDAGFTGSKYVNYHVTGSVNVVDIDWWNGDNEISSVKNNSDYWLYLWDGDSQTWGSYACIRPGKDSSNLGTTHGFNDMAESFMVTQNYICATPGLQEVRHGSK